MDRVILNQEQAREIARVLYADIKTYVLTHKEEFEAFIKSEEEKDMKSSILDSGQSVGRAPKRKKVKHGYQ